MPKKEYLELMEFLCQQTKSAFERKDVELLGVLEYIHLCLSCSPLNPFYIEPIKSSDNE